MSSTASTISTAIDYGRYLVQMLGLFLPYFAVCRVFLDPDNRNYYWLSAFEFLVVWNTETVKEAFKEYSWLRADLVKINRFFPKIRIADEKPLIRIPWFESIIICSLVLWFWEIQNAAIMGACILVLYSYIFLHQLQKRLEEMDEAYDVIARQMEKFWKFQEEIEDFDVVEGEEEAGNSKIPEFSKIEKIEILKDPLTWIICIFLFVVLALESQYWGFDDFALLFLAYIFYQTNIMMGFHRILSDFKSYDKEVLEYQKEIDQFEKSRKN
ncbi:unnamed protein product [Caenorhabditis nigoni]